MSHIKDRLSSYHDFMKKLVYDHQMVLASDVLEMIEQLKDDLEQDKKENGWIPVSEQYKNKQSNCKKIFPKPYKEDQMGYCKLECPDGETQCCICCEKQDGCDNWCDMMDSYEYAEDCEDYVEEDEP